MARKLIEGVTYDDKSGVFIASNDTQSTRRKSWISLYQIENEYPEFFERVSDILFNKIYNDKAKNFTRSILAFLDIDKFISWKQFDSIFTIYKVFEEYQARIKDGTLVDIQGRLIVVKRNRISFVGNHICANIPVLSNDRAVDQFYKNIFGHTPMFEEEYEDVCYRDDGSRYFALPTEKTMERQRIDAFTGPDERRAVQMFLNKHMR